MQRKALGLKEILLDIRPLRQALPDPGKVLLGLSVRGEHQDLFRTGERHIVEPHTVKYGDAAVRLEGRPLA